MALVKKKIDLDSELVEKLRLRLGGDTALTPIISLLLTEFVDLLEHKNIEIPSLIKEASKNVRSNIEE